MPKKFSDEEEKAKKLATYTIKLDDAQLDKLEALLTGRGWETFDVPYAKYAFRGPNCNVTAYEKRKVVVVAGKGTEEFVLNTLEGEITQSPKLGYDEVLHPEWFETHAGLDESGKGDLFGPVITATVIADKPAIESWIKAGVKDSKKIGEPQIILLDKLIRETKGAVVEVFPWTMPKYNDLMSKPGANLNRLLAWQHSQTLMKALSRKWVSWGLLDQFTEQPLVQKELAKKDVKNFELRMRTKAEEDPVVAAASVVARAEFVRQINQLSKRFGEKLQKGAGPLAKAQGHQIVERLGAAAMRDYAKLHFRTTYEIVKEAGKLAEFPLKEPPPKLEW